MSTRMSNSLRKQMALLTLLPLLVLVTSSAAVFLYVRSVELDDDLLTRGNLLSRQLAISSEYGIFSNNRTSLQELTNGVLQEVDVKSATILNTAGEVLATSGESKYAIGKLLQLVEQKSRVFDDDVTVLLLQPVVSAQIILDETDYQPAAKQIGSVSIEMSWKATRKQKLQLAGLVSVIVLSISLVVLYFVYLISRRIVVPIDRLSLAIQAIRSGDLSTRISEPTDVVELSALTHGINEMAAQLQQERDALQHKIDVATEQLRNMAFYDSLTLLPNRRLLNDRISQALAASKRSGQYCALMFLDMDNFKPLNDQYGHAVGDLLLIEVARRITSCIRETDTVARFGGDEFVVMLTELDADYAESTKQAQSIAEKIRAVLSEPYLFSLQQHDLTIKRIEHSCTCSIGIVLFPFPKGDQEEILKHADAAMYQAKDKGRNTIQFFEHTMDE